MAYIKNIKKLNAKQVQFESKNEVFIEELRNGQGCIDVQDSKLLKQGNFNRVELKDIHETLDASI